MVYDRRSFNLKSSSECNIVKNYERRRLSGRIYHNHVHKSLENIYCGYIKESIVYRFYQSDDGRVTEVATHHSKQLVAASSKGGPVTLLDINGEALYTWEGKKDGFSVIDIKFPYHIDNKMLTAGKDGTVKLWDLERLSDDPLQTILNTHAYKKWFCSVAPSPTKGLTIAGWSDGTLTLLDKDYKTINNFKAHKNKLYSIDFNKISDNLFATASLDRKVKIFDIRKLVPNCLETLDHDKPVNSAVFSLMNGQRLLTSDQHSQIRLYSGPLWKHERTIIHPHRQFQHMTPIRASWHPHLDLIVIGRYPDEKLKGFKSEPLKSIDLFSADTGELKGELTSNMYKPVITVISEFNYTGDVLVSGSGLLIIFWHINDTKSFNKPQPKCQFQLKDKEKKK